MKLTLTYNDLMKAAADHLRNNMGITGEITSVKLKPSRKDVTMSALEVVVGEEAPVATKPAVKVVPAVASKELVEEVAAAPAEVAVTEATDTVTVGTVSAAPRSLFGGAQQ